MLHRVHAGHMQHIHNIITQGHRPPDQRIDVPAYQIVRVLVITAKHTAFRVGGDQRVQGGVILSGGAFTDENLHARGDFVVRFLQRIALVIRGDPGRGIALHGGATQSWGMPVNRAPVLLRQADFSHDLRVLGQHPRHVHHLAEIRQPLRSQELANVCSR